MKSNFQVNFTKKKWQLSKLKNEEHLVIFVRKKNDTICHKKVTVYKIYELLKYKEVKCRPEYDISMQFF